MFWTCAQAWPHLKQDMQTDANNNVLPAIATRLFSSLSQTQAVENLKNSLPASYQFFTGLSQSATSILEQNMAINATKNAIQNYGASVGATAGMENYSITKQENTMLLANENSAAQASFYLPMLQTVLFLLLCASFPLVVLLAIQPYLDYVLFYIILGGSFI